MVALQAYGSAVDPVTTKIAFDPDTIIFASDPEKSEAIKIYNREYASSDRGKSVRSKIQKKY